MLTCKTNIEKKLEDIFLNRFQLNFKELENSAKNDPLLGSKINLAPRDLLYVFVDIEEEFNITIPEDCIVEGKFDTFYNILDIIKTTV